MTTRTALAQLLDESSTGAPSPGRGLGKPAATVVLAFLFGAGLLGLAGWFIAASAVAGLAVASTFSFLFPSAGVQALAWARTLARYGERITTHQATLDLVASLRTSLFARAIGLPRDRAAELRSSELLGRITVDSDAVENLLLRSSFPLLAALTALIGAAAMFALLSPALAIVLVGGILLAAAIPMILADHQAGRPARGFVAARARARQTLIEMLDGLPELRSFGAEQHAAAGVNTELERLAEARGRLTKLEAGGRSLGIQLGDLTLLFVVATAAGLLGTGAISAPAFVAVSLVAIAALEPIIGLPAVVTAREKARAASARLSEAFPKDPSRATTRGTPPQAATIEPLEIGLEDQGSEIVLAPGDAVLITGASGTGKSTLLRAITGQPAPGIRVRFAGVDATSLGPDALARHVTLVAQDAHVFDGTVRDNLLLADPRASEPNIYSVLAAAALDETVAAFPAGLDTPIGPGGAALSGGQRRRLSVAQGLLCRADLLLLDEPTEGLDTETAARLLAGVRSFNPAALLIIALHGRQSPRLPWAPDTRLELTQRERNA